MVSTTENTCLSIPVIQRAHCGMFNINLEETTKSGSDFGDSTILFCLENICTTVFLSRTVNSQLLPEVCKSLRQGGYKLKS